MAVDHDRARELHACSLRALMESADIDTGLIRSLGSSALDVPKGGVSVWMEHIDAQELRHAADWIDAVLAAWERQEQR